jgi:hypothetical protein
MYLLHNVEENEQITKQKNEYCFCKFPSYIKA